MKIGYIILVHKKPNNVARLINALRYDNVHFYIHIDKKCKVSKFQSELNRLTNHENLHYLKSLRCYWGSFNILQASLNGMEQAYKDGMDFFILLSGEHYPIKSNIYIHDFLLQNRKYSFIDHYRMPASHWRPNREINRIRKHYFHVMGKLFEYPMDSENTSFIRKFIDLFLGLFLVRQRIFPEGFVPSGGEFWVSLTRSHVEKMFHFVQKDIRIMKFLKRSLISDEIFYQTFIYNYSPSLLMEVKNRSLTLINWKDRKSASPYFFRIEDANLIKSSDCLFARKLDVDVDEQIVDKIDSLRMI